MTVARAEPVGWLRAPRGRGDQHVPGLLALAFARARQNSRQGVRRGAGGGLWLVLVFNLANVHGFDLHYGRTASGRQKVTNLRLPGQYDERLLAAIGAQGPYYNWNRWYLPGVGRYLELDPLALSGRFTTRFGVDWYNYANGNPVRFVDSTGLLVGLYCEGLSTSQHGVGGLGQHCFVRVKCDNCGDRFDKTLEIIGPLPMSPQLGRPRNEPFDPNFGGRGSTSRRGVNGPGMPGSCGTEKCILNAFVNLGANLPIYNGYPGPNSNTFASQLLSVRSVGFEDRTVAGRLWRRRHRVHGRTAHSCTRGSASEHGGNE